MESRQLGAEIVVGFDAVGLGYGELQFQRRLFDGRCDEFETASLGTVGLSDDEMNAEIGVYQFFERRNGEARRAAKNQIQRHWGIV